MHRHGPGIDVRWQRRDVYLIQTSMEVSNTALKFCHALQEKYYRSVIIFFSLIAEVSAGSSFAYHFARAHLIDIGNQKSKAPILWLPAN